MAIATAANTKQKIAVIGAGIAGVLAALKLADQGHDVTIYESAPDILQLTSRQHSARLHLGFHYPGDPDLKTAALCIQGFLAFRRDYADCAADANWWNIVAAANPSARGSMADAASLVTFEAYHAYCKQVDALYHQLGGVGPSFTLTPTAEVTGVNTERIQGDYVILSHEARIDTARLTEKLQQEIQERKNISLHLNHTVYGAESAAGGFRITARHDTKKAELNSEQCDWVINAAWTAAPKIDQMVGIRHEPEAVIRLKPLVYFELPGHLRGLPSFYFTQGPYVSMTNLGDGTGVITYEPITNLAATTQLAGKQSSTLPDQRLYHPLADPSMMPAIWLDASRHGLDHQTQQAFGRSILAHAEHFIPGIAQARIHEVRCGTVITHGNVDLTHPESNVHRRNEPLTSQGLPGWVTLNTGKLSYAPLVADAVAAVVAKGKGKNLGGVAETARIPGKSGVAD